MKKITILIPAYNEAESISPLVDALNGITSTMPNYQWDYLFVNDGSTDNTVEVLRNIISTHTHIACIDLSRNFGKENAMLAGFDNAQGDAVIIMDADLQHPPSVIPEMVKQWEEGYDDVYAQRKSRGKEPWLRKQLSLAYYRMLQRLTDIDILPNVGDFRLLDKKCIMSLRHMREQGRYTKGMYCFIGFKKTGVEFYTNERIAGTSSMKFSKLLHLAVEGITSYSTIPLKIATLLGAMVSLCAFAYMIFVFIKALLYGDPVAGYPTMLIIILFLGGVQLLTMGIMGEYMGKIFNEVKQRPVYIVREIIS